MSSADSAPRMVEVVLDGCLCYAHPSNLPEHPSKEWFGKMQSWIHRRFRPRRWTHVEVHVEGRLVMDFIA